MDSNSVDNAIDSSSTDGQDRLRLQECPVCQYLLRGLPTPRCPECGFEYDDQTFVLTGIPRGMTSTNPSRKWLWLLGVILLCISCTASPLFVALRLPVNYNFLAGVIAMAAIVLMLGLALTSRRKKMQAKESVLFAADGFGYTKDVKRWADTDIVTVPWKDVRAVLIERKGSQWYRLRIGSYRSSRLVNVRLDLGIRCDATTAQCIDEILSERISAAYGS